MDDVLRAKITRDKYFKSVNLLQVLAEVFSFSGGLEEEIDLEACIHKRVPLSKTTGSQESEETE